jgi:hypothetical protein
MSFANMDLAIAGMWIGEDDGVLNPRTLKVGPRKVVVANSVDSLKPLEPPGNFELGAIEMQRLQRAIRKVLMADQLEPQPQPGKDGKARRADHGDAGTNQRRTYSAAARADIRALARRVREAAPHALLRHRLPRGGAGPAARLARSARRTCASSRRSRAARSWSTSPRWTGTRRRSRRRWPPGAPRWPTTTTGTRPRAERRELLGVPRDLMVDEDDRDAQMGTRAMRAQLQQGSFTPRTAGGSQSPRRRASEPGSIKGAHEMTESRPTPLTRRPSP